MRCKTVLRLTDDHVDGLLPARQAEEVRLHLDACDDCREETEAARAASTSLAVWGDLEPPPDCFAGILERIDALPPEAHVRGRQTRILSFRHAQWLATSGVAAAAALLLGIALTDASPSPVRFRRPTMETWRVGHDPAATVASTPTVSSTGLESVLPSGPRDALVPLFLDGGLRKRRVFFAESGPDGCQLDEALPPGEGPR